MDFKVLGEFFYESASGQAHRVAQGADDLARDILADAFQIFDILLLTAAF